MKLEIEVDNVVHSGLLYLFHYIYIYIILQIIVLTI